MPEPRAPIDGGVQGCVSSQSEGMASPSRADLLRAWGVEIPPNEHFPIPVYPGVRVARWPVTWLRRIARRCRAR